MKTKLEELKADIKISWDNFIKSGRNESDFDDALYECANGVDEQIAWNDYHEAISATKKSFEKWNVYKVCSICGNYRDDNHDKFLCAPCQANYMRQVEISRRTI